MKALTGGGIIDFSLLGKLKIKAILFGFLADTVGTLAFVFVLISAMAGAGIPENEIKFRLKGLTGLLLMLIVGLGFTVLGGYVAGRTARQAEVLHGAVVAGIGLVLGIFLHDPGLPLWYHLISFGAAVPAGIAGAYISEKGNARS